MIQNEPSHFVDEPALPSSADSIHELMRLVQIVLHRKIWVLTALVLAGLLGGLYYFTATPVFEASAQLLILQSGAEVWSPNMSGDANRQALIPTYERLFSTQEVLRGAVQHLQNAPAANRVDFQTVPAHRWTDVLHRNLTAQAVRRTNLLELRYRSRAPQAAEAVVQAVVESYLEFMDRNHKDVSAEIVQYLEKERLEIERRLTARQQELLEIRRQLGDMGLSKHPNAMHPLVQRVVRLNESLVKVQQERIQLEASLEAIQNAVREGADLRQHLSAVEPMIGREMTMSAMGISSQDVETRTQVERRLLEHEAELDRLLAHYGEAHPTVIQARQAIQNSQQFLRNYQQMVRERTAALYDSQLAPTLIGMVREKLGSLRAHEEKLGHQYQLAESEAVRLSDRTEELQSLAHDVDRLRNLHDTLLDRIANIDIGQNQSEVRVAVVSEPQARPHPVSPRLTLVVAISLLGGLGVGVALAYVLDVLDDRFRSPEELQDQLNAPLLAMIRELALPETTTGPDAIQVHVAPESVESEAFRTLRTTLAFSGYDRERIAITSAEPSDGKTTVLVNLGVSLTHAGKRTLLIDGDLRRPGLSRWFHMRTAGGLSEILRGDQPLDVMVPPRIQSSGIPRLDILPCGPKPSDPVELLSSPRLADLLAWTERKYDQVIIDCPPVLAASDAAVVGRLTDGLILVVQPEKNHRRLVLRAVHALAALGVGLVGVVANRISDDQRGGYYGYGVYDYGYDEDPGDPEHDDLAHDFDDADGHSLAVSASARAHH